MLLYKNRLILGAIRKFFKTVSTFIYKILKAFRLHLTLLVVLTGIILFFCGVFEDNATAELIYFIVLIASIFYAVIGTVRAVLFPKPKEEKKRDTHSDSSNVKVFFFYHFNGFNNFLSVKHIPP